MSLIRRSIAVALALTLLQSFLAVPALACTMSHDTAPAVVPAGPGPQEVPAGHEPHSSHGAPQQEHDQCASHHGTGGCVAMSSCVSLLAVTGETGGSSRDLVAATGVVNDAESLASRSPAPAVPPPRS